MARRRGSAPASPLDTTGTVGRFVPSLVLGSSIPGEARQGDRRGRRCRHSYRDTGDVRSPRARGLVPAMFVLGRDGLEERSATEVRTASRAAPSKTTRETVTTMGSIRSPVAWCEWNRPRSGGSRPITMRGGPSRSRRESVAISATSCTGAQSRHCSSPISPRAARSWLSPLSRARDQGVGAPHRRIGVARLNRSREAHSWRARHGVPGLRRVVVDDRAPRAGTWQRRDGH